MIENANNSNMALIEQAKQVVDSRLDEMHLISRNITSHPRLDAPLKASSPQNGTENYNYYTFMQEMQRYRNSKEFYHRFYVYLRRAIRFLVLLKDNVSCLVFRYIRI